MRRSFAYIVVSLSEQTVKGCVYIEPTHKRGYDAEVFLWARQSKLSNGLEERLYDAVQGWTTKQWPFENVAFPGRSIHWDSWSKLPDEKP